MQGPLMVVGSQRACNPYRTSLHSDILDAMQHGPPMLNTEYSHHRHPPRTLLLEHHIFLREPTGSALRPQTSNLHQPIRDILDIRQGLSWWSCDMKTGVGCPKSCRTAIRGIFGTS